MRSRRSTRWTARTWPLALVLALVACVQAPAEPPLPVIHSFEADPSAVAPGATVTLSWSVEGASEVRLEPLDLELGAVTSVQTTPTSTTTYSLVAENPAGVRVRKLQVVVGDVPVVASFSASAGEVNPGMANTLAWSVDNAQSVVLRGPGLPGDVPVAASGTYHVGDLPPGATFTLAAANAWAEVEAHVVAARTHPAMSILFAGQSNAQGRNLSEAASRAFITAHDDVSMFGNDYVWKHAYEPLDDCTGQVDAVSDDRGTGTVCPSGVSAGVSLGNELTQVTGGPVFLIPAARGGTSTTQWQPGTNPFARTTLFGSAAHRARHAEWDQNAPLWSSYGGRAYGAVFWYQGESDTNTTALTAAYHARTATIFDRFREVLGSPPIIMAQLSARASDAQRNLLWQDVRETQRRMETGARDQDGSVTSESGPDLYLVVTHDLAKYDNSHLSAEGQRELGRRISLAIRERMLAEPGVDGTGPRLAQVEKVDAETVRVHLDRAVTPPSSTGPGAYSGYFTVFGGGDALPISSVVRSSGSVITITHAAFDGPVEIRYMPPLRSAPSPMIADVVRAAACAHPMPVTSLCLPLPAFGATTSVSTAGALRLYVGDDD